MPSFRAIAAMSENRVIGAAGKIPWRLPDDYRWFKHMTMGGTLVMGRKTFEGIGGPLPGRRTIVLTKSAGTLPGAEICREIDELPLVAEPYWVCGGEEIYRQLLPRCGLLYLTLVKRTVAGDTFFPEFENEFRRDGIIHENADFRVERWVRPGAALGELKPDAWPFPPRG